MVKIESGHGKESARPISYEEFITMAREYVALLESHLFQEIKEFEGIKALRKKLEKDAKQKINWSEKILSSNKRSERKIKEMEEWVEKGKFLLSRKDIEEDELLEYIVSSGKALNKNEGEGN